MYSIITCLTLDSRLQGCKLIMPESECKTKQTGFCLKIEQNSLTNFASRLYEWTRVDVNQRVHLIIRTFHYYKDLQNWVLYFHLVMMVGGLFGWIIYLVNLNSHLCTSKLALGKHSWSFKHVVKPFCDYKPVQNHKNSLSEQSNKQVQFMEECIVFLTGN